MARFGKFSRSLRHLLESERSSDFSRRVYGEPVRKLPEFYSSEQELREIWSKPDTRATLLQRLDEAGFSIESLKTLRELIEAPNSDLFDVLEYVHFTVTPVDRTDRVTLAKSGAMDSLTDEQKEFGSPVGGVFCFQAPRISDSGLRGFLICCVTDDVLDLRSLWLRCCLCRNPFVELFLFLGTNLVLRMFLL